MGNSLMRSLTLGSSSFHQKTHGKLSSITMLNVWSVTSTVVINDVVTMMKTNFPMVDLLSVNDVILMMLTVTIVKTHLLVSNNSQLVSENGPNDTCRNALVNVTTNIKSIA